MVAPGLLAAFLACAAPAAGGMPQPLSTPLKLAGTMDLARLVDVCAAHLRIAIEYDPSGLGGSITIRHEAPLSDAALWDLLNRQLAARGFITIIASGASAYSIVSLANAASLARIEELAAVSTADPDPPDAGGIRPDLLPGYRRARFLPRHQKAGTLAEALRPMLSKPGGNLELLGTSGHLILGDLSPRLTEIHAALAQLDDPSESVRVESVSLQHLSGAQATALVAQLALKREAAGAPGLRGEVTAGAAPRSVMVIAPAVSFEAWLTMIEAVDQLESLETRSYPVRTHPTREVASLIENTVKGEADGRFKAVIDALTDSLVITATAAQHASIEALLARLESLPASERRQMRSIPVRHRPAEELLSIVEGLIAAGAVNTDSGEAAAARSADDRAGITRAPGGLLPEAGSSQAVSSSPSAAPRGQLGLGRAGEEPELSLTLDPGTSTILAIGPPRMLDQVESLVVSLDVRQRQVELQVLLVSLTDNQTRALGAEIRGEVGLGEIDLKLASLFGLSGAAGDGTPGLGAPAGFSGLVLSPGEFSVLLRALETISHGRTLSMPRVIVANNQQASIDAVLQQPFSSLNAGDTVSTTSFGGTQDAGTQVQLRPQVSSADHIILDYRISLSAFVGESPAEGLPPPRQQNRLESMVTIPDGSTIAIGGIELNSDSNSTSQIPLLSGIPVLGELFKNRSRSEGRQRFYAFIRPTILRADDFADLKYLSAESAREAELGEDEPILAPQVIR